jgi:hypothetical protein
LIFIRRPCFIYAKFKSYSVVRSCNRHDLYLEIKTTQADALANQSSYYRACNLDIAACKRQDGKRILVVENDGNVAEIFNIKFNDKWVVVSLEADAQQHLYGNKKKHVDKNNSLF